LLRPGDLLVLNDTRVIPARLRARRSSGGEVSLLLLHRNDDGKWSALARPLQRLRFGEDLILVDRDGRPTDCRVRIVGRNDDSAIVWLSDEDAIEELGEMPLPPYIKHALNDSERYQTVFAKVAGSAAAPTAGLHFTRDLLDQCRDAGIETAWVTLHVGRDTFQPVRVADARDHPIHSETFFVPVETSKAVLEARRRGGRIVAVGTTSVRTLETIASQLSANGPAPISGISKLYIVPGYRFQLVDAMVTNFHLPRTTLLLLVSAFAGSETIRSAYRHAIDRRYRFYSFGDATLIV
jgi:S-adenosylmethionine:tRNA ribosyltransferase-isomerase